jgi:LmbE family N-acetylglucosaminyl deacetylase
VNERAPLPEVVSSPERGRVLVLAPHADDDVLGCGGTASLHAAQGDPVRIVIAYDGRAGDPEGRYDGDELAAIRQREARAGGSVLGLADYEFWGYPEGHEPGPSEFVAGAQQVARLVRDWRPDLVYAPWIGEYHIDHHVLARVARAGLALARFAGAAWGYEVWTPLVATRIVDVTRVCERKIRALEQHVSQIAYSDVVHSILGINAQRSVYLPDGGRYGEAFAPLGPPSDEDLALVGLDAGERGRRPPADGERSRPERRTGTRQ